MSRPAADIPNTAGTLSTWVTKAGRQCIHCAHESRPRWSARRAPGGSSTHSFPREGAVSRLHRRRSPLWFTLQHDALSAGPAPPPGIASENATDRQQPQSSQRSAARRIRSGGVSTVAQGSWRWNARREAVCALVRRWCALAAANR
eukprot:scaffold2552_cov380-Prasinococcus_capsulatus_cf.AAC.15